MYTKFNLEIYFEDTLIVFGKKNCFYEDYDLITTLVIN